jgi:hypothetical protein
LAGGWVDAVAEAARRLGGGCRGRVYHGLAHSFLPPGSRSQRGPSSSSATWPRLDPPLDFGRPPRDTVLTELQRRREGTVLAKSPDLRTREPDEALQVGPAEEGVNGVVGVCICDHGRKRTPQNHACLGAKSGKDAPN